MEEYHWKWLGGVQLKFKLQQMNKYRNDQEKKLNNDKSICSHVY